MKKTSEPLLGGELRSQQAAGRLIGELRSGRYAGAGQLPSEVELAAALGVSRTVVRDALSLLERAGFLERVRGIGTLVNHDVVQMENRLDQKVEFYHMIRDAGRQPHSDHVMVTRETASPALAQRLGLPEGEEHTLVFVRRRVLADDLPVLYSTDVLPLALFGGRFALVFMRKMAAFYTKGKPGSASLREKLFTCDSIEKLRGMISETEF